MGFFRGGKPRASAPSAVAPKADAAPNPAQPAPGSEPDNGPGLAVRPDAARGDSPATWADAELARRFALVDLTHPLLAELAGWARTRLLRDGQPDTPRTVRKPSSASTGTSPDASVAPRPTPRTDAPSLAALLARRPALTTPPEVVQRLSALVTSDDATPDDVARIIQHDTYLTAAVLRIANSPLHAPLAPVETVQRAVLMLGMRQILSLVTAASLMRLMSPRDVTARRTFWRHAACAATAARALAVACGGADPGRAFVAGMLHDIGHLLLMGNLPDLAAQISRRALEGATPIQAAERELLGYDHCDIGRRLLDAWRLGDAVAEAAATHHGPDARNWSNLGLYVHLGDYIAVALGYHMPGDMLLHQPAHGALDRLKLAPAAFSSLVGHVLADTEAMEQALFGEAMA